MFSQILEKEVNQKNIKLFYPSKEVTSCMMFNKKAVIYGHMSSVVALLGPWESVTPQASVVCPGLATAQDKQTE